MDGRILADVPDYVCVSTIAAKAKGDANAECVRATKRRKWSFTAQGCHWHCHWSIPFHRCRWMAPRMENNKSTRMVEEIPMGKGRRVFAR